MSLATRPPELSASTYRMFASIAADRMKGATGAGRARQKGFVDTYHQYARAAREPTLPRNGSLVGVRTVAGKKRWDYTRGPGQKDPGKYGSGWSGVYIR